MQPINYLWLTNRRSDSTLQKTGPKNGPKKRNDEPPLCDTFKWEPRNVPTLQPLQVSYPRQASTRLRWLELRLPPELVVNESRPCYCRGREAHHRRPRPDWQVGT